MSFSSGGSWSLIQCLDEKAPQDPIFKTVERFQFRKIHVGALHFGPNCRNLIWEPSALRVLLFESSGLFITMNETPGKMLSSLTSGDKQQHQHPKIGGCVGVFFNLFDWNKRFTGKKLFSNRLLPAERPRQVAKRFTDEKLPMAKLLLIADENRGGFPNSKKCSGTSEEVRFSDKDVSGGSTKAPGVVARLMGLDSLPSSPDHGKELSNKPFETRPLPELMNQRRHTDFFVPDEHFDVYNSGKQHAKLNGLMKRTVDSRPQKLQKTGMFEKRPVSRFQPDTVPFKSIISPSKTHNKLVSPIKSPGLLSAKNAARLMEAAAKILEPGMQTNNRARNPLIRSSVARPLLRDQEGDEKRTTSKKSTRGLEPLRKSVDSNAIKSLKGQALSKSWNGKEDTDNSKPSLDQSSIRCTSSAKEYGGRVIQDTSKRKSKQPISSMKQDGTGMTSRVQSKLGVSKSTFVRKQEKTLSLALEAKANVQRRELQSLDASSRNGSNPRSRNNFKEEMKMPKEQEQIVEDKAKKNDQKQCISGISRAAKPSKTNNQSLFREKGLSKNNHCSDQSSKVFTVEPSSKHMQRNSQGKKESGISNRIMSGNLRSNNSNPRNFGLRKYGCKDKEDRKKVEEKKSDSSVAAKVSPKKKRLSDGNFTTDNNSCVGLVSPDESNILLERNEMKDNSKNTNELALKGKGNCDNYSKLKSLGNIENDGEASKTGQWNVQKDYQSCSKSMDVISFTFSSPMRSTCRSQAIMENKQGQDQSFDDLGERQTANWRDSFMGCQSEKIISEVPGSSSSSKPVIPSGDRLNVLLEQKLRELTSGGGVDLGIGNSSKESMSCKTTASMLQDLILALNTERLGETAQSSNLKIGSDYLSKAGESNLINEDGSQSLHSLDTNAASLVTEKGDNFLGNRQIRSFSVADPVPPRNRIPLTKMNSRGAMEDTCGEDCEQPSPVSILDASFSNESCNSMESSDTTNDDKLRLLRSSVQNRIGDTCRTVKGHELDSDAELCDSASSANLGLVESDKIMGAILDISRLHKIDPSLIGLENVPPACLEDLELDYMREIIGNAEILSDDVGVLSEEDAPDFLVDPNLFEQLESQEPSGGYSFHHSKNSCYNYYFRKAQESWHSRKLIFDCVKECISLKYCSKYKGGYNTWMKGSACLVGDKLASDILEEIKKWRMMASGMLDDIVEKDMSSPTGKWTEFEREMFEIGSEIEKIIFIDLVEELTIDLLLDT